jgi:hypothetical protein
MNLEAGIKMNDRMNQSRINESTAGDEPPFTGYYTVYSPVVLHQTNIISLEYRVVSAVDIHRLPVGCC